ncbi:MAG: signal peptidase I [Caldisericia bacterium]
MNKVFANSVKMAVSILLLLTVFYFLRVSVLEPRQVRQRSMLPTLMDGDIILVSKLAYSFGEPHRGDIVVFKSPDKDEDLVKRVVGLPGDVIEDNGSTLIINGKVFEKDNIRYNFDASNYTFRNSSDEDGIILGDNEYYVLGDNREVSRDSRAFGPIEKKLIKGQVLIIVWPLDHLSVF